MKGCLQEPIFWTCLLNPEDRKETAMKNVYASVKAVGMDVHYKFSTVRMRDADGKVVRRERLDHRESSAFRVKLTAPVSPS